MENNRKEFLENNGKQCMGKKQSRTRTPLYFTRPKNAALLFAALAFLNAGPLKAGIVGFNTNGVTLRHLDTWYLDEAQTIRLSNLRVAVTALEDGIFESAIFPSNTYNGLHLIADSSSNKVAKLIENDEDWDQNLFTFQNKDPYFDSERSISFADGVWGNFEADPNQSGYFGFRFDLNGDGDAAIDQFQYGWARISFSEIVDTLDFDRDAFSITLHEWAWGGIDETDFPIGQIPEPSTLGLMGAASLVMYLNGCWKRWRRHREL